ncbi:hypothetical protein CIPAW_02G048900 [Carya illinoinensis]|uniref:Uncharacterized protein n=1 Tax=Carya illinoinensis TaxID=32201 RepID=A0A8T1RAC0_CARIL|nr:hypothetical protein CIPAW_02G048900 [Carya illinoinensis]
MPLSFTLLSSSTYSPIFSVSLSTLVPSSSLLTTTSPISHSLVTRRKISTSPELQKVKISENWGSCNIPNGIGRLKDRLQCRRAQIKRCVLRIRTTSKYLVRVAWFDHVSRL